MEGVRIYGGKELRKKYLLSLEWKRVGVMHSDSVDDETDEPRARENWVEKREKKNDREKLDGKRQEVYSKSKEMHNEMSGQ